MSDVNVVAEPAAAHAGEVTAGERFEFGKNWASFLRVLNDERIAIACQSLTDWLGPLEGKTFLDIGCGSGLFSLSAARLGAAAVTSIDYDPHSVACARELKRRYFPEMTGWTIEQGSCLDDAFVRSLPSSDVVYIWGVAHHTGDMWKALANAAERVKPGGQLFTAIYNDEGWKSQTWRAIKRAYCSGPVARAVLVPAFFTLFFTVGVVKDLASLRNPVARYTQYKKSRGMSKVHDWYDWLGGYPFEVARAEEIFRFFRDRGFVLHELRTDMGHGNNEFVFQRKANDRS